MKKDAFTWFHLFVLGMLLFLVACDRAEEISGEVFQQPTLTDSESQVETNRTDANERYVLFADSKADKTVVEKARAEVSQSGFQILKSLSQTQGFVAVGNFTRLQMISQKHGLRMEKDLVMRIVIPMIGGDQSMPNQVVPSGITQIGAHTSKSKGAGVSVCVVDTGISLNHPDLKANIQDSFNTIKPRTSAEDDNGHGSHVAGTIAAIDNSIGVLGVAPQAKIIAAKALNAQGGGYSSDLAEAIDGCVLRKAKVISASWGSSQPSGVIQLAVNRALSANIFFVAAAGNDGQPQVGFPANLPGVIAVSAVDIKDDLASFSNYGREIAHAAPGVNTLSTYRSGKYKSLSGTSMATPHVSGVAALLLSGNPNAKPSDLDGVDIGLSPTQQGYGGRIDASGY